MRQFILPDLGEGLEEAEIVTWHVNEGDRVVVDQPLVSVETDKAVVEVPSPWSGRIARLFGGKGDLIKVGAPLVEFAEGEQGDTGTVVGELGQEEKAPREAEVPTPTPARTVQVLPAVRALARKLDVDLNLVHATGPGGTITRADVERAAKSLAEAGPAEPLRGMRRAMAQRMAAAHAEVVRTTVNDEADIDDWRKGEDVTIRLVRAIAAACQAETSLNAWYNAEAGERRLIKRIDIGIAVDTEGGLIVPVLRNVGERDASDLRHGLDRLRADAAARSIPPEELRGATITRADVERAAKSLAEAGPAEPLRGMRRAMAQRMAAAHAEVVRTTVNDEADIDDWRKGEDVTIRLVRAIASACQAESSLNAWYNAEAGERRLIKRIDIGIAVDTEGGLIVPVLRNVGERDASDLRHGLDRLRADAAARSIPPEELRGATITLSNFGMIGGRFANLIVVPPQVAIIGAGRIDQRVLVHNGQPAARRVLPLSLTVDHRVVTGGEAARFLVALKSDLERAS
jgi:2-oxoisovalerate dehydrogenase E2 component (dihydrolipoyl transacylase)